MRGVSKIVTTVAVAFIILVAVLVIVSLPSKPQIAVLSEKTAKSISGENYTYTKYSVVLGSLLQFNASVIESVDYLFQPQSTPNGIFSNYYFEDTVYEFSNSSMASALYGVLSLNLQAQAMPSKSHSAQYRGFYYTYTTTPHKEVSLISQYFWGTVGLSMNQIFEITGVSESAPSQNMSSVAIEQINSMIPGIF